MNVTFLSPAQQGIIVLYSILTGVVCGAISSVFDLLYYLFSVYMKKIAAFMYRAICDILFSIICAAIAIIFVYGANDGVMRYFILMFFLLGFVLYYVLLGKRLCKLFKKAASALRNVVIKLLRLMAKLLEPVKKRADNKRVMRYIMEKMK